MFIAECNNCGGGIEPEEICIRTSGDAYHLACQDALIPEVERLEMTGKEAMGIDAYLNAWTD